MKIYCWGIKGSGMAGLATLLFDDGHEVTGCDVPDFIYTQKRLEQRNIIIHDIGDESYLNGYFVIVGHQFMTDDLKKKFNKQLVPYMEYHDFISSYLSKKNLVSICGSHGKTTLTGLLASGSKKASCLRGDGYGFRSKKAKHFFLESCEYQDHFLTYYPSFIIITNIDYDHVDYFKTEEQYIKSFKDFASKSKKGLVDYDSYEKLNNPNYLSFGINDKADFYVKNYKIDHSGISGDLYFRDKFIISFSFNSLFGEPLLKDVIAALAFYYLMNEDLQEVIKNMKSYKMATKRFNLTELNEWKVLIDDYAHHPTQILANLYTVKAMYPGFRYICCFKPDRESRLVYFVKDYIKVFSQYSEAYLVDYSDKRFEKRLKSMCSRNLHYLEKLEDLDKEILSEEKSVFLLMSSKDLRSISEYIKGKIAK